MVYVNAGTQLASIDSTGDILSPALIGSFVLLGLFPLIAKWLIGQVKRRRVYRGYHRPRRFDRNLVVIGAGAGGLVTAYIAAAVRAKVTLVEAGTMGGDCLNTGCVPSKALIRSARLAHDIRHAADYGMASAAPSVDFKAVMARVRDVIATIAPADSVERTIELGVDVRLGHATIVDPWTVQITDRDGGTQRLTTRSIVIAAGAEPLVPDIPGLAEAGFLTSDTMWDALSARDALPRRLTIVGGGPIGTEMAQAFARLGSAVTLIEAVRGLAHADRRFSDSLPPLRREGVDVRTATSGAWNAVAVSGTAAETSVAFDLIISRSAEVAARVYGPRRRIETGHTVSSTDAQDALPEHLALRRRRPTGPIRRAQAWYSRSTRCLRVPDVPRRLHRDPVDDLHRPKSPTSATCRDRHGGRLAHEVVRTTSPISTVPSPRAPIRGLESVVRRTGRSSS